MKAAVGSINPVKIAATREALDLVWADPEVDFADVDPGISDQPTTDKEAIDGSINRAQRASEMCGTELGVGLEGSTEETQWGMFLTGWAAISDSHDRIHIGAGGNLQLPSNIADRIRKGEELGSIMEKITGREGVKHDIGAIGVFTGGIVTRKQAYKQALIFALSRFIRPDLYEN
ncbi:MAG: inosine/xanthosine triphosphatase [Candidatus Acetothermia bacterium]